MRIEMSRSVWFALMLAMGIGDAAAQQVVPVKRAKDIRAEQTPQAIYASPLCQRAREKGRLLTHVRVVDPTTLEPDLASLMENSDEVVLAGAATGNTVAVSPSGDDAVHYEDFKILRSWKGPHKVGDTLTFAIPSATLFCRPTGDPDGPSDFSTIDRDDSWNGPGWKGSGLGPSVLFLRQAQGEEKQLTPGLRLTGGDGYQGQFWAHIPKEQYVEDNQCTGALDGSVDKCNAFLDKSQIPVSDRYIRDPMFKKYDGMPISRFLNEVQSVAESFGYAPTR